MPTAYILPATSGFLNDDGSFESSAFFQQSSITLIYDDAIPNLDYRVPDPDLRTSLLVPSTSGVVIDDVAVPALNAEGLDVEIEISRLNWDGGSTVVLRTFQIPVDPDDWRYFYPAYVAIAELGGDPLPLLAIGETDVFPTQSDVVDFFNDNRDNYVSIPEGQPFGPRQGIPLATLPDVETRGHPTEGPDEITGGSGVDVIDGLGGNDTLNGGPDRDELSGGPGNDLLRGGAEDDILRGGEGDDVIRGQGGRDMLEGGPGADILIGGRGTDTYLVDRHDTIVEDPGDFVEFDYVSYFGVDFYFDYGDGVDPYDRVWAEESFRLDGPGFEIIQATGTGPIRLDGTPGNEGMIGNEENNILVGRGGSDGMTGRGGADTFVLTGQFGTAPFVYLSDFSQSEGDRIAVDDQLLGLGRPGIDVRDLTPEEFSEIRASGVARYDGRTGELLIDTDGDGTREVVARIAFEDLSDSGPILTLDDFLLF